MRDGGVSIVSLLASPSLEDNYESVNKSDAWFLTRQFVGGLMMTEDKETDSSPTNHYS